MDMFYSKLASAKSFVRLTIDLVVANFISIILLYLVSTALKIAVHFALLNITGFISITYYIYALIDFFFINIIIAYMVRCYSENVDFDLRDSFGIIFRNIIGIIIFVLLVTLLAFLALSSLDLTLTSVLTGADIYSQLENTATTLLIILLVGSPIFIYFSTRFGYFTQLIGLYDVSLPDAFSGSFQITKNMFLKILILNLCIFWEILLFNFFAKDILEFLPYVFAIIIPQLFTIFYAICNAFIALNLVCLQEEDEEEEQEYTSTNYNNKVQTYIDTNNFFDYNTDNEDMGESKVSLLSSNYDIPANDSDNDPWRFSN